MAWAPAAHPPRGRGALPTAGAARLGSHRPSCRPLARLPPCLPQPPGPGRPISPEGEPPKEAPEGVGPPGLLPLLTSFAGGGSLALTRPGLGT